MDFEAFKEQFEFFSKIDTPEKLAICESRYQSYLLHLESQQYFEPEMPGASSYLTRLRQILETDEIRENEFYFLIQPAFDPEVLLVLKRKEEGCTATIKALEHNYWYSEQADNPAVSVCEAELPETFATDLFNCIGKAMDEAKKLPGGNDVIDGIKYFLSRRLNGEIQTVSKHSPDESSGTGNVISVLTSLAAYVKTSDPEKLEAAQVFLKHIDQQS